MVRIPHTRACQHVGEVEEHGRRTGVSRLAEHHKLPLGVLGHGVDRLNAHRGSESVRVPRQALVEGIAHRVGEACVVCQQDDRAVVAKLPLVRAAVHFLPRKAAITREKGIALAVRLQS